jgi:allophanate hydrolase subunit 2
LPKFVRDYNDTVHSTTGMAPSRVTDADVLAIWKRKQNKSVRIKKAPTFRVGQHVRISKEKMRFTKAAEQNFSSEIFKVTKVIERSPRVVYEIEDINGTTIDGHSIGRN